MALPESRCVDSSDYSEEEDEDYPYPSGKEERRMLSKMSEDEELLYWNVRKILREEGYEQKHCNDELYRMFNMVDVFGYDKIKDMGAAECEMVARKLKWKRWDIRESPMFYNEKTKRLTEDGLKEIQLLKTVLKNTSIGILAIRHRYF